MNTTATDFDAAAFQQEMSKNLGIEISPRKPSIPSDNVIANFMARPQEFIGDDQLFDALNKSCTAVGFTMDVESLRPEGDEFTWVEMEKTNIRLSISVSNSLQPPFCILITINKLTPIH